MRHPAGELADDFQLLRLAQRLLGEGALLNGLGDPVAVELTAEA